MGAMVRRQLGVRARALGIRRAEAQVVPRTRAASACPPSQSPSRAPAASPGMTRTAVRDGTYILKRQQSGSSAQSVGDLKGLVVRTGPGSKGLSGLVESTRGRVSHAAPPARDGLHGSVWGVDLKDCRIKRPTCWRRGGLPSRTPQAGSTGGPTSPRRLGPPSTRLRRDFSFVETAARRSACTKSAR